MITLIVARARNNAIGRANSIPWHIPEDLKSFKQETLGGAIIMGRRTWESLPTKPLPNRLNLVVTKEMPAAPEVVRSLNEAVERARQQGYSRIYGIGGAAIYRDLLPMADRLLITEVETEVKDADAFFPDVDLAGWTRIDSRALPDASLPSRIDEYIRNTR